ncbi:unnamed protein product [Prorocentrum cordatum]|uniref:Cilia- and flagella-associated protein 206 n=1 Tax=Prorocentrum cordatum TaxID=2364126 RepID=A0ABN9SEK6_9DINO|nr:unnamed protein product [Polarella glacialis]
MAAALCRDAAAARCGAPLLGGPPSVPLRSPGGAAPPTAGARVPPGEVPRQQREHWEERCLEEVVGHLLDGLDDGSMWYLIAELLASGVAKVEKVEATAREGEGAGRDERVADGGRPEPEPEPEAYAVPARRQARGTPLARPPQHGEDDRGHLALSMSDAWGRLSVDRGAPGQAIAGNVAARERRLRHFRRLREQLELQNAQSMGKISRLISHWAPGGSSPGAPMGLPATAAAAPRAVQGQPREADRRLQRPPCEVPG